MPIWTPHLDSKESIKEIEAFLEEGLKDFKLLEKMEKSLKQWKPKQWKIDKANKLLFEIKLKLEWKKISREVGHAKKKFTESLENITWINPFDDVFSH